GNANDGCNPWGESDECRTRRGAEERDHAPIEQQRDDRGEKTLHNRLKSDIKGRRFEDRGSCDEEIGRQIQHEGANSGNGCGVKPVETSAPHGDGVAGPYESGGQEKRVAYVLFSAQGTSPDADNPNGANDDQ